MKSVLAEIQKYIEKCQNCKFYHTKYCGYIFQDRDDWRGSIDSEEFHSLDDETRTIYLTQIHRYPCDDQQHPIKFLNNIEERLQSANYYGLDLTDFFSHCHRLLIKLNQYDGKILEVLGESVKEAILKCLAYLDYDSLKHGENIMRYIREAGLEYTREKGLFQIYPKVMAIKRIEISDVVGSIGRICLVQEYEDYDYWNEFKYNPVTEDVNITTYSKAPQNEVLDELNLEDELPDINTMDTSDVTASLESDLSFIYGHPQLKQYLDALKEEGYLDDNYKWVKRGHTMYHAGIAAKIIIYTVKGVTYNDLTDIIGVTRLANYASDGKEKDSIVSTIKKCFTNRKLPINYV